MASRERSRMLSGVENADHRAVENEQVAPRAGLEPATRCSEGINALRAGAGRGTKDAFNRVLGPPCTRMNDRADT